MGAYILSTWSFAKTEKWQLAFMQLLEAAFYAQDLGQPLWDFAVEVQHLELAGLTANDLRWLKAKGYIEEATEIAKSARQKLRRFRPPGSSFLGSRSCIVLTKAGLAFVQQACRRRVPIANPVSRRKHHSETAAVQNPRWDCAGRKLFLGSSLIKSFNVPAANQQLILTAFEEQGWPSCIDDPLHPKDGVDPKRRVRDAVAGLNRSHKRRTIRFGSKR